MPDHAKPANWTQAFAALPLEPAPVQGWERLAARMDSAEGKAARGPRAHARAPAWIGLAVAATLVLSITLWEQREPRVDVATPKAIAVRIDPIPPVGAASAAIRKPASRRKPEIRIAADAAPTKPAPTKPAPTKLASTKPASTKPAPTTPDPLPSLYTESAQLEALLAVARDDRVSSAGAALLSDELDAQVASIDGSLARPDLSAGERLRLWQARVDTLRQAAGFETTQRLLASQGRSDVMLVSVD